tara:strand:+ start:559 stop:717 length:159 start_codon:yes stop_codon:yes gene_type:complete
MESKIKKLKLELETKAINKANYFNDISNLKNDKFPYKMNLNELLKYVYGRAY